MKKIVIAVVAGLMSVSAYADEALAKKNNCLACHAVDKKLVGPAFKDIAAKYKGQSDAVAKLATKVQKGGVGVWGPIPMPANPAVSAKDAEILVKWILTK